MQEQQATTEKPSYLKGAAILAAASVIVKLIGAIYKIPLFQDGVLGDEGTADFQVTYSVYSLILTISTAGIPAALSRLISSSRAEGNEEMGQKYFSVAIPAFFIIGLVSMLIMFFFAQDFALMMRNSKAELGIRVLSPAVFFACIIAVYRGYAQGAQNMMPTALSQIVEVMSKSVFGIIVALWLASLGYDKHIVSAGAIVGVTIGLGLCIPLMIWYKKRIDGKPAAHGGSPGSKAGMFSVSSSDDAEVITVSSVMHKPSLPAGGANDSSDMPPGNFLSIFSRIMQVSIPITLSAAFMSIMVVVDNAMVLGRLQSALLMSETQARGLFGVYTRATTVYNLIPALLVPVSISIIPAIAAALAVRRHNEAKNIMQSSVKLVNLIAMPASAGIMVLALPILTALYNDQREIAVSIMTILGAASFFVCLQYITTAILQANGFERISLITFPIGAACKIIITYVFAANPAVGILASPIGTLACFVIISVLNLIFIKVRIKEGRPELFKVFTGPFMCSAVMAAIAYFVYSLLSRLLDSIISNTRFEAVVFLTAAVITGIVVYCILIIITRTVTMDDMKLLPRGEKIGKFLKVK